MKWLKKLLPLLLALLLLPVCGSAATYYVCPAGTPGNTPAAPYTSWATAANLLSTIVNTNPSGGPHTVYVAPGTYEDAPLINSIRWDNSVWQGTNAYNSISPASEGQVIVTASGANYTFRLSTASSVAVKYMTLQGAPSGKANLYLSTAGHVIQDVVLQNAVDDGFTSYVSSAGIITLTRVKSRNNGRYSGNITGPGPGTTWNLNACLFQDNAMELNCAAATAVTVNHSIFKNNKKEAVRAQIPTTINNCNFEGNNRTDVLVSGNNSQQVALNNCIFNKNGTTSVGYFHVSNTSSNATVVLNNCMRSDQWTDYYHTWTGLNGTITDTDPVSYKGPLFRAARRTGIIVVGIDDAISYSHASMISGIADLYGAKVTWAVNSSSMTSEAWTIAQSMVSRGHEIASHSRTHADLTSLDDTQLTSELSGSADDIQTNVGVRPTTLFYPNNYFNATVRQKAYDTGYIGAKAGTTNTTYLLSSITPYAMYGITPGQFGLQSQNPTEIQLRSRIRSLCEYLSHNGGCVVIYAQNGSYDYDFTESSWRILFDEIAKSNVRMMTFRDAVAYIASNYESASGSGGSLTYTRSESHLGDASDYRLRAGSPCAYTGDPTVWAGTPNVFDFAGIRITDSKGNIVLSGGRVPIGAYAYRTQTGMPFPVLWRMMRR